MYLLTVMAVVCSTPFCNAQPEMQLYYQMCDASAAVAINDSFFIVANDEDNILRIYHQYGTRPAFSFDLSRFLDIEYDSKSPESDLEGATPIGSFYFFISSFGRNKSGAIRYNRHQFFALHIDEGTFEMKMIGRSHHDLLKDIIFADEGNRKYLYEAYQPNREKVGRLAPKKQGVNIEGLAATPDGKAIYIGFRNPLHQGKALLVKLNNPFDVVLGRSEPDLSPIILLDLEGKGIRCMEYVPHLQHYFIIAGPRDGDSTFAYYLWSGKDQEAPKRCFDIGQPFGDNFTPEAFTFFENQDRSLFLSDDGTTSVRDDDGRYYPCKKLENRDLKRFRGMWVPLDLLSNVNFPE